MSSKAPKGWGHPDDWSDDDWNSQMRSIHRREFTKKAMSSLVVPGLILIVVLFIGAAILA